MANIEEQQYTIRSIKQLEGLYEQPVPTSLTKEIDYISDHYQSFIEKAPFVVIASIGPDGMDCSPRGDPPGFARVIDRHTVLLPDRRGNNRLDTLRNIVQDPRVSLIFLIPGVGETIRINGTAEITTDPNLCASFEMQEKLPKSIIKISVERIYFQCQKALARSKLWHIDSQIDRLELPTAGQINKALSTEGFDAEAYDNQYPERMKRTIY